MCGEFDVLVVAFSAGCGGSLLPAMEIHPARGATKWRFCFAGRLGKSGASGVRVETLGGCEKQALPANVRWRDREGAVPFV